MPPTRKGRRGESSRAERRVERVRRLLMQRGMPRVLMSLILAATGAAGFLVSFALLHLGVTRMWLRYPFAVLVAYGVFLLLLRVWLHLQRHSWTDLLPDDLSLTNINTLTDVGAHADAVSSFGGGGDFAGAGSGGVWDEGLGGPAHATPDVAAHAGGSVGGGGGGGVSGSGSGGSGGGGFDLLGGLDFDDEGCVFFLLALALIVAGLLASLYVVYAAPTLLAELLVEGILLSGLYRGMKKGAQQQGDWLRAVVRRTWLPVLLTLTLFAAAGYLLQRAAPRARSIGEAFRAVSSD